MAVYAFDQSGARVLLSKTRYRIYYRRKRKYLHIEYVPIVGGAALAPRGAEWWLGMQVLKILK